MLFLPLNKQQQGIPINQQVEKSSTNKILPVIFRDAANNIAIAGMQQFI